MDLSKLDKALLPYEKYLRTQERLRKVLGVREVESPTYERYIVGPIERWESGRNAFVSLQPEAPHGEAFRLRFKRRTGHNHYRNPPPYNEMELQDRIGLNLARAGWRVCSEYAPEPLPLPPRSHRLEVTNKPWLSRLIKKVALLFGAEIVGITEIDQRWVYRDVTIPHKYAIVVGVHHKRSLNNLAPSHYSWLSTTNVYSMLKSTTTQLADFIRELGYDAIYRETLGASGPELLMVPLAIDAGIGEFARTGRVLSPEFGINMRLKAVTTDLPLKVDKPISFGVHDFCMTCESCAKYCPANAIPEGPPSEELPDPLHNNPGCRKWYINAEKCITFWGMNRKKWLSCGGRCIAVCPWNKPLNPFHNAVRWNAIHLPAMGKRLLVWGDKMLYRRSKKIVGFL
jgi:reductive dehalogenase